MDKEIKANVKLPIMVSYQGEDETDATELMIETDAASISVVSSEKLDIMKMKQAFAEAEIAVNTFESAIPFSEFKLNEAGLIPVVTQDYKTNEVLMVAYMNQEAYEQTIATGKMTYFSRSRNELWVKGATSGHIQYVKALSLDCDYDTILA